jgi:hypothetical protein
MKKNGASSNTTTRRSGNFVAPPSSTQDPLEDMRPTMKMRMMTNLEKMTQG